MFLNYKKIILKSIYSAEGNIIKTYHNLKQQYYYSSYLKIRNSPFFLTGSSTGDITIMSLNVDNPIRTMHSFISQDSYYLTKIRNIKSDNKQDYIFVLS